VRRRNNSRAAQLQQLNGYKPDAAAVADGVLPDMESLAAELRLGTSVTRGDCAGTESTQGR